MRKITTLHKIAAAGLALTFIAGAAVPSMALAKKKHHSACEAHKDKEKTKGMIIGGVVGGVAGNLVTKNHKGVGTVAGAAAGALVGQKLAKDKVKCND